MLRRIRFLHRVDGTITPGGKHFLVIGVVVGLAVGAVGAALWTHHVRFRALEDEAWSAKAAERYAGSGSCRECHEKFYKLWEPSHHGKAMQPATRALFRKAIAPLAKPIEVSGVPWSVDVAALKMVERAAGGMRA